jgi:hypothetical protein
VNNVDSNKLNDHNNDDNKLTLEPLEAPAAIAEQVVTCPKIVRS